MPALYKNLLQTASDNPNKTNKKISDKTIIKTQVMSWTHHLRNKNKYASLYFHPGLTVEDEHYLTELNEKYTIKRLKWSFGLTAMTYMIYNIGFKHKAIFYTFVVKNPSKLRNFTRLTCKYFVIPITIVNVFSAIVDYFSKDFINVELKDKGLLKKYHLDYLLDDKPF